MPDSFVDAVTLAGPPEDVAAGVIRLARQGVTSSCSTRCRADGRIEVVIERFQREVMPRVRARDR